MTLRETAAESLISRPLSLRAGPRTNRATRPDDQRNGPPQGDVLSSTVGPLHLCTRWSA
jgi:hypothetical protein